MSQSKLQNKGNMLDKPVFTRGTPRGTIRLHGMNIISQGTLGPHPDITPNTVHFISQFILCPKTHLNKDFGDI